MGARIPKANWQSEHLTNANLVTAAQDVINGLTAAAGSFPAPPVPLATMQSDLNNYSTALAASIGGSLVQRATMRSLRAIVRSDYRANGQYVNQVITALINGGLSYAAAQALITTTAYQLNTPPSPVGPLPKAIITKFSSPAPGQLYVLIQKIHGAKAYILSYGDPATFPSVSTYEVFPNSRILRVGFTPGTNLAFAVAGQELRK